MSKKINRTKNFTEREKSHLLTIVEKYKSIIECKKTNAVSVIKKNEVWEKVALEFNRSAEIPRSVKQLSTAYVNLKRITRQQNNATNNEQRGDLKAEAEFPELASTENQLTHNFTKVFKRCIALIVKHGRPAELLDDEAFQDILSLIPLRQADRKKLTRASITAFMESHDIGAASSYVGDSDDKAADDADDVDDDDDSPTIRTKPMKVESIQCTCNSSPHDEDCPAWSTDVYWSFYEVSIDEATCKLCSTNIKWSHMVDLKEHLKTCHPDTPFEDDDDVFDAEKTTADSDNDDDSICKPDESNDIYLEDPLIEITHSTKAKKRKNSTTNSLNDTEKLGSKSAFVTSPSRSKNESKPNNFVTLKDSEMICLERFKSLDRFGLYIASLMKLLPKDKSERLQEQIVQRLIREQAAAG